MNRVYGSREGMLVGEDGEDTAEKCRERRRRRMAIRRVVVRGHVAGKTVTDNGSSSSALGVTMNLIGNMETLPPPPMYGSMSVIGRQRQMLDEVCVRMNLCRPEISGFQPVHFFGVFDGHVSTLCKEHMPGIMNEELMRVKVAVGDELKCGDSSRDVWKLAINRSFQMMNEMAVKLCQCRGLGSGTKMCRCNPQLCLMGSAAVVSVLTKECMVVANSGDSRAVLCRDGRPIPVSFDHKADEGGCGGRIVARPIDEIGFWATSEPEISITKREARDECLILGSNGLWDVVSSESACKTARECLRSQSVELGSEIAANILVRLALGRRSTDNISVIVIDLRK